jgi:cell division protease FtsH
MVMRYGMVKTLGNISYDDERTPFVGQNFVQKTREFSEETAREIDVAVRDIVRSAYDKTLAILNRQRAVLESGAQRLLDKETLAEEELEEFREAVKPAELREALKPA